MLNLKTRAACSADNTTNREPVTTVLKTKPFEQRLLNNQQVVCKDNLIAHNPAIWKSDGGWNNLWTPDCISW